MRILFATNPLYGHFLPAVPLVTELRDRGHDVTVASEPAFLSTIEGLGLTGIGVGRDLTLDDTLAVLPEIFEVSPEDQDAYARPRVFVELRAHNTVDDLDALVTDQRPDLIVRELGEFGSWAVAERHGIPHLTVNAGAASTTEEWDGFCGPWFSELGRSVGLDDLHASSLYRYGVFAFEPAGYADWSAVPTARVYQPPPPPAEVATPPELSGLDDRPLVYLTLGTEFFDADRMSSMIGALAGGDWNLVATTGPKGDPAAVDPGRSDVVVARWIDQDALMGRTAAVVSHAGGGTTMASLVRGVPLVCVPQGADQFDHARRVDELGAGIALGTTDQSPDTIRAAVERILADPSYRDAAGRIARATTELPDVATAAADAEAIAARR